VALAKKIEKHEKPKAAKRKAQAKGKKRGKKAEPISSGKLPEETAGDSRDKVAEAVGMSGSTYEHARAVVEAAAAGKN
jgi:hypothetical protein